MLLVLLAAAVLVAIDCGREEHREQVTKVENVDTDNSAALGPILVIFDVLEITEHDTGIDNITLHVVDLDLPELRAEIVNTLVYHYRHCAGVVKGLKFIPLVPS